MRRNGWRIKPVSAFPAWREEWARLNREITEDNPILQLHFVEPALKYFATGRESLALLYRAGEVAAAAILKPGPRLSWEVWCPSQLVVAPALLPSDLSEKEVRDLFRKLGLSVRRLIFWRQDPKHSVPLDVSWAGAKVRCSRYWETIAVDLTGDFAEYWANLPPKLRNEVGRRLRRAERELGELDWRVISGPGAVGLGVDRYGELESQGWKGAAGTALHPTNVQGAFYREVLKRFAEQGGAIIFELASGGRPISSSLYVKNNKGVVIALKITYDEMHKKISPGILVQFKALDWMFGDPECEVCEFYTNADKEKKKWATESRFLFTVEVFRDPFSAASADVSEKLKKWRAGVGTGRRTPVNREGS